MDQSIQDLELRNQLFINSLLKISKIQDKFNVLTSEQYQSLLQEVKSAKSAKTKTPVQRKRDKRYAIITLNEKELLVSNKAGETIRRVLILDEIYSELVKIHQECGHGG